jgi:hypothetical protein
MVTRRDLDRLRRQLASNNLRQRLRRVEGQMGIPAPTAGTLEQRLAVLERQTAPPDPGMMKKDTNR